MQQSATMLDATASEKILSVMKERFRVNQLMEGLDEDDQQIPTKADETNIATIPEGSRTQEAPQSSAALRWDRLRKVVRGMSSNSVRSGLNDPSFKSASVDTPREKVEENEGGELEMEDIELSEFWNADQTIPQFVVDDALAPDVSLAPVAENVDKAFVENMMPMKVEINRIPEPAITEKQEEIKQKVYEQYKKSINDVKKLQTDVIWREDLARKRVLEMEKEAREKVTNEKLKLVQLKIKQEKDMKKQFRKAREELEVNIKRQEGAIREHFGKLLVHEESLARRFHVFTRMFPQPIEIRVHLLRAVKDKLPKGSYVMMLTMYDSLGGNPLLWSNVGANGIGKIRPGITKIAKHQGRYFDRVMRFEDSCFALCPPRPQLKPSYVFVFELFQLASSFNPTDKIVAWSAVPMSFESMSIIEGKIKLPLLRGEHTPAVQHFLTMERLMASDLNNWLCNMYIEVRHMSLHELGATEDMLKLGNFDLDYLNKQILTESIREQTTMKQLSHEEAILQAMKAAPLAPGEVLLDPNDPTSGKSGTMKDPVYSQLLQKQYSQRLAAIQRQQSAKLKKATTSGAGGSGGVPANGGGDIENQLDTKIPTEGEDGKKEDEHKQDEPAVPPALSKPPQSEEELDAVAPILPVDKGIFRRKGVTIANPSTSLLHPTQDRHALHSDADLKIHNSYRSFLAPTSASWWSLPTTYWYRLKHRIFPAPSSSSASTGGPVSPRIDNFSEYRLQVIQEWKEKLQHPQTTNSPLPSPPKGHLASRPSKKAFTFDEENPPPSLSQGGGKVLSGDEQEDVEVRERGYNVQDEVFLHKEQRGKLFGMETLMDRESQQWASAGMEGKIVRRWQSEGSRFDSDAVPDLATSDQNLAAGTSSPTSPRPTAGLIEEKKWEELRDNREMLEYTMTIASDPTRKKHLIPGSIARSKLRYLSQELFGDLMLSSVGSLDFVLSVCLYALAAWLRIYVHYVAQYLYLLAQNTPVYAFDLHVLFISFKYSSETLSTATEVGVVAIGPIATTLVFMVMMICGMVLYQWVHSFPTVLSKFFAYYGVMNILNPLLIFLIDLFYHHYACELVSSACEANYNAQDCACYYGDFIKLWYRMITLEGSGFTGAFLTAIIYLGIGVLSCLLLHEFLLYIHRSGRILDLWRRINANSTEEFFLPDDFEISYEELQFILKKNVLFNTQSKHLNITRRVVVQEGYEQPPPQAIEGQSDGPAASTSRVGSSWYDALVALVTPDPPHAIPTATLKPTPTEPKNRKKTSSPAYCKRYLIYQYNKQTKQEFLFRHFLLNGAGQIFEIFHDLHSAASAAAAATAAAAAGGGTISPDNLPPNAMDESNPGKMHLFDGVVHGSTNQPSGEGGGGGGGGGGLSLSLSQPDLSSRSSPVSPRHVAMQSTSKLYTLPRMDEVEDEVVNDGLDDLEGVEGTQFPDRFLRDDVVTSPMHTPQRGTSDKQRQDDDGDEEDDDAE